MVDQRYAIYPESKFVTIKSINRLICERNRETFIFLVKIMNLLLAAPHPTIYRFILDKQCDIISLLARLYSQHSAIPILIDNKFTTRWFSSEERLKISKE